MGKSRPIWSTRFHPRAAVPLAAVMLLAGFAQPTASSSAADPRPEVQRERSIDGAKVPVKALPADPAMDAAKQPPPPVTWPQAGAAEADVPAAGAKSTQVGELPVWVSAGPAQAVTPERVRVEIADAAATRRAGVPEGILLSVKRADAKTQAAEAYIEVDYSAFRHAYGGDWASRLRLQGLPDCDLATPDPDECAKRVDLASRNHHGTGRVSAKVPVSGGSPAVVALAASAGGGAGSYGATSLSPSATWQVSAQTGDFGWTYPMRTPPASGGPSPQTALSYSSGGVDGRTVSTNNQPSWIGEGFDFSPGFIERKYKSCADDGVTPKTGDLCWSTNNATMVLNGGGGELIRDDTTGAWKLKSDDGSRIEQLTGAANGDDNGEHWRVSTPDGTKYHFGLHRLPGWTAGKPETKSAWTVPVYGDDAGEPCHATRFCDQAWRWNLDYVVDPSGNVLSYYYQPELNNYGMNLTPSPGKPYVRGGWLDRIEYGQRDGSVYDSTAPQRVTFSVGERCIPTATFNCGTLNASTAQYWPDVPYDQNCDAGAACTGKYSPTFWTRKRLTKITTQVWHGSAYRDVDSWSLDQAFPPPGDGTSPALWLESIKHTGHVGGTASMPEVNFDGVQMPNRVDALEGLAPLYKWRVGTVHNETGGQVTITYAGRECVRGSVMPATPDTNIRRCFPQRWQPPEGGSPVDDWFHKHVVAMVAEIDRTGRAPDMETRYEYLGTPAWHYNDDEELVPAEQKTWAHWRGYERVRIRRGASADRQSLTELLFFRGMDEDRLAGGGKREVQIVDSDGVAIDDFKGYQGMTREEINYNGPTGSIISRTFNEPWRYGPTARRGPLEAYVVKTGKVAGRTLRSDGSWWRTEVRTSYDQYGIATQTEDLGDTATGADDRCTRFEYARNPGARLLTSVSRAESLSVNCSATPDRPADVLSDVRTYYDGATSHTTAPTRGLATKVEELSNWDDGPEYVTLSQQTYDAYGRSIESYDSKGAKSTTAYTPATGGPITGVTSTNPLGHESKTQVEPAWGLATAEVQVDADGAGNDRRTDLVYDPLGRLLKAWLPGRSKAAGHTPNGEYTYLVRTDGPVAITSKSLKPSGEYVSGFQLYDGFLRLRQSQIPAPGGGRALADTQYDSRGFVAKRNTSYYNSSPPGIELHQPADNEVPSQTLFVHDGAGRQTDEIFRINGVERWRTTTTASADWTTVDPPAGATPIARRQDVRGRLVELRQYKSGAPAGPYDMTSYTYNKAGQLAAVTDPAGNDWRYSYDLRGRQVKTEDPDQGTSQAQYDDAGRLTATTDGRGRRLTYSYDALDRRTGLFEGSTKLADWTYDTLLKGLPTASTRYSGGQPYTTAVTGYNSANLPTGSKITIPDAEGALAGTYQASMAYNGDGSVSEIGYPAGGGLAAEKVSLGYDTNGLPSTLTGATPYVTGTTYSKFAEPLQYTLKTTGKAMWLTNYYEEGTRRTQRTRADRDTATPWLKDTRYTYDPAGNITKIADTPQGQAADTQCFGHDHLRRMTEAWTPGSGDCGTAPSVPALGGPAPYWHSYTYDQVGNRLSETRHSAAGDTRRTFAYPAAGTSQPHTLRSVTSTGPDGSRLDQYGYDAAGNTTSRNLAGNQQALEWDSEGHLAKVTEDGKTTSFLYGANGSRLLRRDPDGTTLYLGLMELRLNKSSNIVTGTRYYSHGSALGVRTSDGQISWMAGDHHGTASLASNAATLATTQRRFSPFGEPRGQTPSTWPDQRGFVSGTVDSSTGLTHLGAREYDPSTGRFISVDPVMDNTDPQQMQGYSYGNNSPATFSDPDGLIQTCTTNGGDDLSVGCRPPGSGGAAPGGGGAPPVVPTVPNEETERAKKIKSKSVLDIVIEEGGKLLLDLFGITDIINCVTKGDIGACVSTLIGLIPWGKLFKVGKAVGKAVYRVVKGYLKWQDELRWADDVIRKADELAAAAKKAEEAAAAAAKQADEAAAAAAKQADEATAAAAAKADDAGKAAPSCPRSFPPNTPVLLANGTHKPIKDLKVGDKVQAHNPSTGKTGPQTVVATFSNTGTKRLVQITIANTGTVIATDTHPFWVPTQNQWVQAGRLKPGMWLRTSAGTHVQIAAIQTWTAHQHVHNLTVNIPHTYYALAGPTPLLVHNCDLRVISSEQSVAHNRASANTRQIGDGFSGIFHPGTGRIEARLSNGPDALVDRRGGHRIQNQEFFGDSRETVAFVAIAREGGLEMRWNSLGVNLRNFGGRAAPAQHQGAVMDALRTITGLNVWG